MIYNKNKLEDFFNQLKQNNINTIIAIYSDGDLLKDVNYYLGRSAGDKHVEKIKIKIEKHLSNYKTVSFQLGGEEFLTFFENINEANSFLNEANKFEIPANETYIDFLKNTNITAVGMGIDITTIDSFYSDINQLDLMCSKYKGHKYRVLPEIFIKQMCRISHEKSDINFINKPLIEDIKVDLSTIKLQENKTRLFKLKLFNKTVEIKIS